MSIDFQAFPPQHFTLARLNPTTQQKFEQSATTPSDPNPGQVSSEYELYTALDVLDRDPNPVAAQSVRDQIFDHLFATGVQQKYSELTKGCSEQILGCVFLDQPIHSLSPSERTIYEWRTGVDDWTERENFTINRRDLRTGRNTGFIWDAAKLGSIRNLGAMGSDLYVLYRLGNQKISVGKMVVGNNAAWFHPIDPSAIDGGWWNLGSQIYCDSLDFGLSFIDKSRGRGFSAVCWRGGLFDEEESIEMDLTAAAFSEGVLLSNLNTCCDHLSFSMLRYSGYVDFRSFLKEWAGVYTAGNTYGETDAGLENLRADFGADYPDLALLFFAGYFRGLAYDTVFDDAAESRADQIKLIVEHVNDRVLQTHMNAKLDRAGRFYPGLLALKQVLSTLRVSAREADYANPILNPEIDELFVPNHQYASAADLVMAHGGHFATHFDWQGGRFHNNRPTQGFSCRDGGLGAYFQFAQEDAVPYFGSRPFTEEQLNIMLDYFAQFSTSHMEGTLEKRLNEASNSVWNELRYLAGKRLKMHADSLGGDSEAYLQNFAYNIQNIQEVSGFMTFLDRLER